MAIPEDIVCRCCFVREETIREVIAENGLNEVDQVGYHCNAGTRCGGCREIIQGLITEIHAGAISHEDDLSRS